MFKAIAISLAAGGVTTSMFEYFLKYNLIDLIVEKVKSLFGKGEKAVQTGLTDVAKHI